MLEITFDKRLELIYGLLYCTKIDKNVDFNFVGDVNPEYDKDFYNMYKKGITKSFSDYIINGGLDTYNRCLEIALSLDDDYEIQIDENIKKIIESNPSFNYKELSKCLKEFVEKANYEDFYYSNKDKYERLCKEFEDALNNYVVFTPNIIEDFYGYSLGEMKVILLNFSIGSYGTRDNDKILFVNGLNTYRNNAFSKHSLSILFHEFSHPYVNPLGEKYFGDIDISNLYDESKNNGLEMCYARQITLINEYMVRSIDIYLSKKYFEEDFINNCIKRHKKLGYTYIEEIIELLDKKDNYSSFEEFYKNEIGPFFIKLNNSLKENNNGKVRISI